MVLLYAKETWGTSVKGPSGKSLNPPTLLLSSISSSRLRMWSNDHEAKKDWRRSRGEGAERTQFFCWSESSPLTVQKRCHCLAPSQAKWSREAITPPGNATSCTLQYWDLAHWALDPVHHGYVCHMCQTTHNCAACYVTSGPSFVQCSDQLMWSLDGSLANGMARWACVGQWWWVGRRVVGRLVELRKEEVNERLPGASQSSWNLVHRATW